MAVRRIDLVDPTRDELLDRLPAPVDPGLVELLATPGAGPVAARPALEGHGTYVIGWVALPTVPPGGADVGYAGVAFIATHDAVLTVRHGATPELPASGDPRETTAGAVVHRLLDDAAEAYVDLVDWLFSELDELEDGVETLDARTVRGQMRRVRQDIVRARRTASLTRAMLRGIIDDRVDLDGESLFPRDLERLLAGTAEKLLRVTEELDVARDLLAALRDHYHAKIAEAQNDIVRKLTVIASLVLVPTLITGFYGQNFEPEFGDAYWRLWVSLALIAASTAVQLALFRWRRWL